MKASVKRSAFLEKNIEEKFPILNLDFFLSK